MERSCRLGIVSIDLGSFILPKDIVFSVVVLLHHRPSTPLLVAFFLSSLKIYKIDAGKMMVR